MIFSYNDNVLTIGQTKFPEQHGHKYQSRMEKYVNGLNDYEYSDELLHVLQNYTSYDISDIVSYIAAEYHDDSLHVLAHKFRLIITMSFFLDCGDEKIYRTLSRMASVNDNYNDLARKAYGASSMMGTLYRIDLMYTDSAIATFTNKCMRDTPYADMVKELGNTAMMQLKTMSKEEYSKLRRTMKKAQRTMYDK